MPGKNVIKYYKDDGFYHIYNRGTNKQEVFLDEQDAKVFLSYLKEYLSFRDEKKIRLELADPSISYEDKRPMVDKLRRENFFGNIELLCFGLKKNHFHLLIKQAEARAISEFMRSLLTRYVMYFNRRYNRVGSLFQGIYRAVLIESNRQLLHLSRYIHRQTIGYPKDGEFILFPDPLPSSYQDYLGQTNTVWVNKKEILYFFNERHEKLSYKHFVETYEVKDNILSPDLTLER